MHRNGGDGQLSKAVQSSLAGEPDVAFPIFEKTAGDVAREAVRLGERVRLAILHMDESSPVGPDPDTAIAVPKQLVGFDDVVRDRLSRIDCASEWIGLEFVASESLESCATDADQELSIGGRDQVAELLPGISYRLGGPGFHRQSPDSAPTHRTPELSSARLQTNLPNPPSCR